MPTGELKEEAAWATSIRDVVFNHSPIQTCPNPSEDLLIIADVWNADFILCSKIRA